MANEKRIDELPVITSISGDELLVIEQEYTAKAVEMSSLKQFILADIQDGNEVSF